MGYRTYICPVQRTCGGCQWLNVPYPLQLKRKQSTLEDTLGGFCSIDPIVGMETPIHYRNKMISPFAPDAHGHMVHGLFAEGSHRIVPVRNCLVVTERACEVMETTADLAKSFKIRPYDEDRHTGLLRYVLIRSGFKSKETMVTLVCASRMLPSQHALVTALKKRHPDIMTVVQNVNSRDTNAVLGKEERTLFGRGWISDELCGLSFRISSSSFFQTNPSQTEVLYEAAMDMAELSGSETVIDAYCGIGTIGLIAAKRGAAHVVGVERNENAVHDARANARYNDAENIDFIVGDATEFMRGLAHGDAQGDKHAHADVPDVVFLDPPRSGASPEFIDALISLKPPRIVYISCNPATQARDMDVLVSFGYRVQRVQPVDMFPHTPHVETVALMTR